MKKKLPSLFQLRFMPYLFRRITSKDLKEAGIKNSTIYKYVYMPLNREYHAIGTSDGDYMKHIKTHAVLFYNNVFKDSGLAYDGGIENAQYMYSGRDGFNDYFERLDKVNSKIRQLGF